MLQLLKTQTRRITFLCYLPDYKDPECLQRRLKVRELHLKRAQEHKPHPLQMGGAMIKDGKMAGSVLLMDFDSIQECRDWVKQDPYYLNKVWDPQQMDIFEYKIAIKQ
ncbi:hypothetical protein EDD86DRAFT_206894 [Gorgonomyces haynaldii]|nr:hypothetical protein EDD86DRAFT_206894 [Gorgonomyces haynaldii]